MQSYTDISRFIYVRREQSEDEIKKAILFTMASKRVKFLGVNLKEVQSLYPENHKILLKEMKDLNEDIPYSCPRRCAIVFF